MCDIACVNVKTPNKRYRKWHWKFSLRPLFNTYKYTEPYPLTNKLILEPVNPGYENSRLITPESQTVAELTFERSTGQVKLDEQTWAIEATKGGLSISNGRMRCFARRVRPGSRVLELEWGIQKLRIVPVHACRKDFVACVVEQSGRKVEDMKVVEVVRTKLNETYDVRFVEFARLELVACIAWFTIAVNRS